MSQLARPLFLLGIVSGSLYALSNAQLPDAASSDKKAAEAARLNIVPLVMLKPGETKELLLSTWCTVGVTRGGGFSLTEMRGGKPLGGGAKSYSNGGVTASVPSFEEGKKFASADRYSLLQKRDIEPFQVTVSASQDAKPGFLEFHLVDATCYGHCKTDFRVLVVEQ